MTPAARSACPAGRRGARCEDLFAAGAKPRSRTCEDSFAAGLMGATWALRLDWQWLCVLMTGYYESVDVGTGRALSFGMTDRTSIALRLARLTDTRSKRVGFWEALEFSIEQAGVYMAFEGATRDEVSDAIFDAGISLNLAAFAGE